MSSFVSEHPLSVLKYEATKRKRGLSMRLEQRCTCRIQGAGCTLAVRARSFTTRRHSNTSKNVGNQLNACLVGMSLTTRRRYVH